MLDLDIGISLWFNGLTGQWPLLDKLVLWLGDAHFLKASPFVLGLWHCWWKPPRDRWRPFVGSTLLAVMLAMVLARVIQEFAPFHPRPIHAGLGLLPVSGVNLEGLRNYSSLPSDHAALFSAFVFAFWRANRGAGVAALLWVAGLICLPRLYLGYHYPSDILAGWLIGFGAVAVVFRVAAVDRLVRWGVGWEGRCPAWFYPAFFLFTAQLSVMFNDLRSIAQVVVNAGRHLIGG